MHQVRHFLCNRLYTVSSCCTRLWQLLTLTVNLLVESHVSTHGFNSQGKMALFKYSHSVSLVVYAFELVWVLNSRHVMRVPAQQRARADYLEGSVAAGVVKLCLISSKHPTCSTPTRRRFGSGAHPSTKHVLLLEHNHDSCCAVWHDFHTSAAAVYCEKFWSLAAPVDNRIPCMLKAGETFVFSSDETMIRS